MVVKETLMKSVRDSVISSSLIESVFSIVIKNRKTFLSVSYDYMLSDLLVFSINECFVSHTDYSVSFLSLV